MKDRPNMSDKRPTSSFREGGKKSLLIAFFLGIAIIAETIILGRSIIYHASFLAISCCMAFLWRKNTRPLISLVAISATTPIAIAKQQFNGNIVYAMWLAVFNFQNLLRLPKWLYIPSGLVLIGLISSSLNWISSDLLGNVLTQGAYAINFFFGPFLLLPAVYLKMRESRNHTANLKGLLYFLIIPSTVVMVSAKLFGSISNFWEASQHVQSLAQGFFTYRLGNMYVNFTRTQIGFILAAMICASTAIAASPVKLKYRVLATACLAANGFLLLSTASFGSGISCFLGLVAIFYTQLHKISISKVITSVIIILTTLVMAYALAPASTKEYLAKRFEHRVTNSNTDRLVLWQRGIGAFIEHPEGVGLTLSTGNTYVHNDYIVYAMSYGLFGGLGYVLLVVGLLFSFLKMRKKVSKDPPALAVYLAGLGVLVALLANGITDHSNENRWYFNAIWSLIWYCYFCSLPAAKVPVRQVAIPGLQNQQDTLSNDRLLSGERI